MLYHEFMEGTGCRETDYNYKVYKELEIIYMNTNCTKQHIYDMGKKLVDNSPTEAEIQFRAKLTAEIQQHKYEIANLKQRLEDEIRYLKNLKDADYADKMWIRSVTGTVNYLKESIKEHKREINKLKWVLA